MMTNRSHPRTTNPFTAIRHRRPMNAQRGKLSLSGTPVTYGIRRTTLGMVVGILITLAIFSSPVIFKHHNRRGRNHHRRRRRGGANGANGPGENEPPQAMTAALNFSSIESMFLTQEYQSIQEQDDRPLRFPSVEDRVRLYMSNWYAPSCLNNADGMVQYNFQLQDGTQQLRDLYESSPDYKLYVREVSSHTVKNPRLFELQGLVRTDSSTLFYLHPHALAQCTQEACLDAVQSILPYAVDERNTKKYPRYYYRHKASTWGSSSSTSSSYVIPTLLDFGDKEISTAYYPKEASEGLNPALPRLKKYRLAYTKEEIDQITSNHCIKGRRDDGLAESTQLGIVHLQPIIWKLKISRHYGALPHIQEWDIPYHEKRNKAVFRGRLSGIHKEGLTVQDNGKLDTGLSTDRENCMRIPRCRLVLQNAHSHLVDARLVGPRKGLPASILAENVTRAGQYDEIFADERMSIRDMLKYKAIIMMEGNDVASGLKWALYSNSVVLMEPVTVSSWAMEERLKPWVHFVPIHPNGNNVEERFRWVLNNPIAAQRIARNGALWIKDLLFHPQAAIDEEQILHEMMDRYRAHFIPNQRLF